MHVNTLVERTTLRKTRFVRNREKVEEPLHLPVSGLVSRPPVTSTFLHSFVSLLYGCSRVVAQASSERRPRIACATEVKLITPAWPLARLSANTQLRAARCAMNPATALRDHPNQISFLHRAHAAKKPIAPSLPCRPEFLSFFKHRR